jgi:hypothetical protein
MGSTRTYHVDDHECVSCLHTKFRPLDHLLLCEERHGATTHGLVKIVECLLNAEKIIAAGDVDREATSFFPLKPPNIVLPTAIS